MKLLLAPTFVAALLVCGQAQAAVPPATTFKAYGIMASGATISGSINISTTLGLMTGANLAFGAPESTTQVNPYAQGANYFGNGAYGGRIKNAAATYDFNFFFGTNSLLNYSGGDIGLGCLWSAALAANSSCTKSMTLVNSTDVVKTFIATGLLSDGAAISGSVTIDTTIGKVLVSHLVTGAPDSTTQTFAFSQSTNGWNSGMYGLGLRDTGSTMDLNVLFDTPNLVNYNGGSLQGNLYNLVTNTTGANVSNLTLSVPVPEPESWALLCGGLLALGLVRRRRSQALMA